MQRLLDRGLVYATEDYGHVDFTVPPFDEFMRRHMPFKPAAPRTTKPRPEMPVAERQQVSRDRRTSKGLTFSPSSGINPNSPAFLAAQARCQRDSLTLGAGS